LDYNGSVQYNPPSRPNPSSTIDVGVIWPTWDSVNTSTSPTTWLRGTLIPTYRCPSDPSLGSGASGIEEDQKCYDWCAGDSSYGGNFLVFGKFSYDPKTNLPKFPSPTQTNYENVWDGNARIPRSMPDGTSNTIVFAEKYARCEANTGACCHGTWWMRGIFHGQKGSPGVNDSDDSYPGDNLSAVIGGGSTGSAVGPTAAAKFLVQPKPFQCDYRVASTPHAAIQVAMADGSVHSASSTIDPAIWYALLTPNGGEVLPGDWGN
jgi:hypothetical protein